MLRLSYTYLVYETNKGKKGLKYIGSRLCPPGLTPWTDTKYVGSPASPKNQNFAKNKRENKEKMILGIFYTREEALAHEIYLHNLYEVDINPEFANQAKQTSIGFIRRGPAPNKGKSPSKETRKKLSEATKGRTVPLEIRKRQSKTVTGKNNPFYGKTHTVEARQRWSEMRSGKNHHNYDDTLRDWINNDGRVELQITTYNLRQKYKDLSHSHLSGVISGTRNHHKGWRLMK